MTWNENGMKNGMKNGKSEIIIKTSFWGL